MYKRQHIDLSIKTLKLPSEFDLINLLQDDQSETATLSTRLTVGAATRLLENSMSAKGWRKQSERQQPGLDAVQLYYTRAKQTASVFIANDETWNSVTLVYINRHK